MPPMLHKGSSCCPCQGEVQHVSWAPCAFCGRLCKMFAFKRWRDKCNGLQECVSSHSLCLVVCVCVGCRCYKGQCLTRDWVLGVEMEVFALIHWLIESCSEKRIILSNPISKKNKIAAMPSLCSWRSGETDRFTATSFVFQLFEVSVKHIVALISGKTDGGVHASRQLKEWRIVQLGRSNSV